MAIKSTPFDESAVQAAYARVKSELDALDPRKLLSFNIDAQDVGADFSRDWKAPADSPRSTLGGGEIGG